MELPLFRPPSSATNRELTVCTVVWEAGASCSIHTDTFWSFVQTLVFMVALLTVVDNLNCQVDWIWNQGRDTLLGRSVRIFPGRIT